MVLENFCNGDLAAWLRVTDVLWHVTDTLLCSLWHGFLPRFYVIIQVGPWLPKYFFLNVYLEKYEILENLWTIFQIAFWHKWRLSALLKYPL